jgi:hypothetical protein
VASARPDLTPRRTPDAAGGFWYYLSLLSAAGSVEPGRSEAAGSINGTSRGVGVMAKITSIYPSDRRYLSLRIIGNIFTLVGIVLVLVGAVLLVYGVSALLSDTSPNPPRGAEPFAARQVSVVPFLGTGPGAMLSLLWSFASLFSGLQTLAVGALFRLAIQLEENTRASAQSLDTIRRRLESGGEAVEPLFRA